MLYFACAFVLNKIKWGLFKTMGRVRR